MKQYTFKDGTKIVASTKEEAIKKHKVVAGSKQYILSTDDKTLRITDRVYACDKNGDSWSHDLEDAYVFSNKNKANRAIKNFIATLNSGVGDKWDWSKDDVCVRIFSPTKATAVFRYNELIRLNRCLELLEKQTDICGKRLYFSVDVDTETVKVFLTPEKKDVYLTVNVGGDSTAAAMYDIWDAIYSKI